MTPAVVIEIEQLRGASLASLREKYRELFGEETRCHHRVHLIRRIAWRLQSLAEGDLSERARARAGEIARDADLRLIAPKDFWAGGKLGVRSRDRGGRPRDPRLPLPGSQLIRQWQGRSIIVEVLAGGFRFEEREYSSLSAIATEITGTRWNGLAFFGLTSRTGSGRNSNKGGRL